MLKNWVIVWFGNLAGALVAVALIYFAQVYAMNGGAVGQAMVSVAAGKVSPDWFTLFAKGIMCNILVCLAVWIGFAGRTVTDKVIGIILPISAFVACGFEHCVANMYFFTVGGAWSLRTLLYVLVMTLGNLVKLGQVRQVSGQGNLDVFINLSVIPPNADTTTTTGSFSASTIFFNTQNAFYGTYGCSPKF